MRMALGTCLNLGKYGSRKRLNRGLKRNLQRRGVRMAMAALATMGRPMIQPILMVGSSAMGPSWWITLGILARAFGTGFGETYLTMMRPTMSSSRAALTRTMPTRVWTKSRPVFAPLMTTKVVPREVADRAAPMMNVSTAPAMLVE